MRWTSVHRGLQIRKWSMYSYRNSTARTYYRRGMCIVLLPALLALAALIILGSQTVKPVVLEYFQQTSLRCKKETDWPSEFTLIEEDVPANGIFFFGTASALTFVPPRQLCVIESAARYNPNRTVFVSWGTRILKNTTSLARLLDTYKNIKFSFLNLTSWLQGTTLEPWLDLKLLETASDFPVAHASDMLRCASLYKHGGIYLDLDMLVLRNLDRLRNALGFEIIHWPIGTSLLAFDKGHPLMRNCLERVWEDYKPNVYVTIGPPMVDRVMKDWCGVPHKGNLEPGECNGVTMLHSKLAYWPYERLHVPLLYEDNAEVAEDFGNRMRDSYTIHLWNSNSALWPLRVDSNQPVSQFVRNSCPLTASMFDVLWNCDVHHTWSPFSL